MHNRASGSLSINKDVQMLLVWVCGSHLVGVDILRSFEGGSSEEAGSGVPIRHPHNAVWDVAVPGTSQEQQLPHTGQEKVHRLMHNNQRIVLREAACSRISE